MRRSETFAEHGASADEIKFLAHRRVELNAMTADVFVSFLARKLTEHGVRKVLPDRHARRVIEQGLIGKLLHKNHAKLQVQAASAGLPKNPSERVTVLLERRPEIPWDAAVTALARGEE